MEDKKDSVSFGGLLTEPPKLSKVHVAVTEQKKERFSKVKSVREFLAKGTLFAQVTVVVVLLAAVFFTFSSLVFLAPQEEIHLAKSMPLAQYANTSIQMEDRDHDGLPDIEEVKHGTNTTNPDTDGDGLADGWEVKYGLNPNNPTDAYEDPDKDGLSNLDEYVHNTNPNNIDTDGDGIPDGWEISHGLNPLDAPDASQDPDRDNLTNLEEYSVLGREYTVEGLTKKYAQSTNIYSDDTDNDRLSDWAEIYTTHTDPCNADTDGDGMPDGWEVLNGLDSNSGYDANTDNDTDSLSNINEYRFETNPNNFDTDGDGMPDGWEVANRGDWINGSWQLNPLDPYDATGDSDNDTLTNLQEYLAGTIPYKADTDDDGLSDYEEVVVYKNFHPDPTKGDTDNDGLTDYEEVKTYHTNCSYFDTDYDGLSDYDEVKTYRTDPKNPDTDGDGLRDYEEVRTYRTDPCNPDTDYDCLNDYLEVTTDFYPDYAGNSTPGINGRHHCDPNNPDTDGDGLPDGWEYLHSDIDGDGTPTWWELLYGLDPLDPSDGTKDFDRDGVTNLGEYMNNTDPLDTDTNRNGISDGSEKQRVPVRLPTSKDNRINPLDPADKYMDPDNDGLLNIEEYKCREKVTNITADPNNPDTDGGGLPDGWEYENRRWHNGEDYKGWDLDPLKKDSDGDGVYDYYEDPDNDSLVNYEEYLYGGDPHEKDSDYDGMADGKELHIDSDNDKIWDIWELKYGLNPFDSGDAKRDRDGDGYTNLQEFNKLTDPTNPLSFP